MRTRGSWVTTAVKKSVVGERALAVPRGPTGCCRGHCLQRRRGRRGRRALSFPQTVTQLRKASLANTATTYFNSR